jgi:hypothetical protein
VPARTIAPGLEGNGAARDDATFANRLVAPAVQQAQKCGFIRQDLLQGLAFDPRHRPRDQPTRLAQLDNSDQSGILLKRDGSISSRARGDGVSGKT